MVIRTSSMTAFGAVELLRNTIEDHRSIADRRDDDKDDDDGDGGSGRNDDIGGTC